MLGVRTDKSLPIATLLLWLISLVYFKFEANTTNATVIKGVGEAATPIAIVFGAIALFESMKLTPVLDWTRMMLKKLSQGNKAGELFLIAWAFSYLIEGCSGFGTPTALSAPLLCELGYDPLDAVVTCLIMNTLATPFGAAGTPIWFGFDNLGFDDDDFITIGFWAQVVCFAAAHVVPFVAVGATLAAQPRSDRVRNLCVALACIYSCSLTSLVISFFSSELPTLLGGFVGLLISAAIVRAASKPKQPKPLEGDEASRVELAGSADTTTSSCEQLVEDEEPQWPLWKYAFPISMVVFFLTLTRAPYLDIKDELRSKHPRASMRLGSLGEVYVSTAVVVGLEDIFREPVATSFDVLYNPAFLPFFVVSLLTLVIFDATDKISDLLHLSWERTRAVIVPITAALIFAQLMRAGVSAKIARPLVRSSRPNMLVPPTCPAGHGARQVRLDPHHPPLRRPRQLLFRFHHRVQPHLRLRPPPRRRSPRPQQIQTPRSPDGRRHPRFDLLLPPSPATRDRAQATASASRTSFPQKPSSASTRSSLSSSPRRSGLPSSSPSSAGALASSTSSYDEGAAPRV